MCRVTYHIEPLLRVSICVVPMPYLLIVSRSGDMQVLYRLLALFVLRGILGHSLTLFKSKFILLIDTIIIAKYYYMVNSLTDP